MQFKYYVINYNTNKKTTELYNIFNNISLNERTRIEIKKYLRNPSKYKYIPLFNKETYYGFEALVKQIDGLISWQERARSEYEFGAGYKFRIEILDILREIDKYDNVSDLKEYLIQKQKINGEYKAWDCYDQAHANIECVVRECIYQYKQYEKENRNESIKQ